MQTDLPGCDGAPVVDHDYPLRPVPAASRKSLASLGNLITIILAGRLLLGAYVAAIAAIGASNGLTTVLLSRYTLGRLGAKWAGLILGGTQLGWYAFTAAIVAVIMTT